VPFCSDLVIGTHSTKVRSNSRRVGAGLSLSFSVPGLRASSGSSKPAAWRTMRARAAAAIASASRRFWVPVER
jgi:hypothetical protein